MFTARPVPLVFAAIVATSLNFQVAGATPRSELVDQARLVARAFAVEDIRSAIEADIKACHGVVIVPGLLRAALGIGGQGGSGVLYRHDPASGTWGPPEFYDIGGAGIGAQIGFESQDVILVVMSASALETITDGDVGLSAGLALTMGSRDPARQIPAIQNEIADIHVYSRGEGAYVGADVGGMFLSAKEDWNTMPGAPAADAHDVLGPLALASVADTTSRQQ